MKNQALFSSKDEKIKSRLLQFLFGTLRVNNNYQTLITVCFIDKANKD